jgi:hypothetical protein
MKKSDIHPLYIYTDSINYTSNPIDNKKRGTVTAFLPGIDNEKSSRTVLFKFKYEPILNEKDYNQLSNLFSKDPIFEKVYNRISFGYQDDCQKAQKWYFEKTKINNGFDYDLEIKKYKDKIKDNFSCPIIKDLNLEALSNTNIYRNLLNITQEAIQKNITSIQILLYGTEVDIPYNKPLTPLGKILVDSVSNISYLRFLAFLELEQSSHNNQLKKNTIKYKLIDNISTKDCFLHLKKNSFIDNDTMLKDFDNLFREKESKQINWIGSLPELARFIYLLHNDYLKEEIVACCEYTKDLFTIGSECFTLNNQPITKLQLQNNNREITDKTKMNKLKIGLNYLQNPKSTTLKR